MARLSPPQLDSHGHHAMPMLGSNAPDTGFPPEGAEDKRRRRTYRWKIILGLFCPFALQSLDVTIIASALPFIATDFGQYLLTYFHQFTAITVPWLTVAIVSRRDEAA
jgi:hypothetical protein